MITIIVHNYLSKIIKNSNDAPLIITFNITNA